MIEYTHLVGRAGKDIERVRVPKNNLAKFTLAVETGFDPVKKESITTWYDVAVWDDLADTLTGGGSPSILKGARVWVSGRVGSYTSSSGIERPQISARDIGLVERFMTGPSKPKTGMTIEFVPEPDLPGVDYEDEKVAEW